MRLQNVVDRVVPPLQQPSHFWVTRFVGNELKMTLPKEAACSSYKRGDLFHREEFPLRSHKEGLTTPRKESIEQEQRVDDLRCGYSGQPVHQLQFVGVVKGNEPAEQIVESLKQYWQPCHVGMLL
jgi:hypothetical protein